MKIVKKVQVPIYNVEFTYTNSIKEFNKVMGTEYKKSGQNGLCGFEKGRVIIWVPTKGTGLNIPTLTHECFHAADAIMNMKGMEYCGTNEHVAYLLGYLVNVVLEALNETNPNS